MCCCCRGSIWSSLLHAGHGLLRPASPINKFRSLLPLHAVRLYDARMAGKSATEQHGPGCIKQFAPSHMLPSSQPFMLPPSRSVPHAARVYHGCQILHAMGHWLSWGLRMQADDMDCTFGAGWHLACGSCWCVLVHSSHCVAACAYVSYAPATIRSWLSTSVLTICYCTDYTSLCTLCDDKMWHAECTASRAWLSRCAAGRLLPHM